MWCRSSLSCCCIGPAASGHRDSPACQRDGAARCGGGRSARGHRRILGPGRTRMDALRPTGHMRPAHHWRAGFHEYADAGARSARSARATGRSGCIELLRHVESPWHARRPAKSIASQGGGPRPELARQVCPQLGLYVCRCRGSTPGAFGGAKSSPAGFRCGSVAAINRRCVWQ